MGTRFHLGLNCAALVAALGGCGRANNADQSAPDTSMINASAALFDSSLNSGDTSRRAGAAATDDCPPAGLRGFVGKPDNPATHIALAAAAGTRKLRWVKPGTAVTQDLQPSRINVIVGDDGRISSLRCG